MNERPILIVDCLNVFVRAYCAFPQMNVDGEQMGGYVGFLKMMQRVVSMVQPRAVYAAWESGGSQRRRSLDPEYKKGRRPEKLNRFYEDDIPDTDENRKRQMMALLSALKNVPICQLYVQDCEGDDLIAHLCMGPLREDKKTIMSSDKDMFQLLDERTNAYNMHKKTFVGPAEVLEEFRVTSKNFALAKALCGDVSDNVKGIKGIGFKTCAKKFPMLGTDDELVLQDVIDYAAAHSDESPIYRRVVDEQDTVRKNWRLVYLDGSMLSNSQAMNVNQVMADFKPKVDRMGLMKCLMKEGINDFDVAGFFQSLNCIEVG
jgi:DNA polymerase-1